MVQHIQISIRVNMHWNQHRNKRSGCLHSSGDRSSPRFRRLPSGAEPSRGVFRFLPRYLKVFQGTDGGFSLLEMLTVFAIVGIIAAIAVPGWASFRNTRRLNTAQDQIYQALRQAQFEAKRRGVRWQISVQNRDEQAQWAIYPVNASPLEAAWTDLPPGIQIDTSRTTVRRSRGIYEVQFNHKGHVNGQLGRITLVGIERSRTRRSVVVSTLIGAMRKANNNVR